MNLVEGRQRSETSEFIGIKLASPAEGLAKKPLPGHTATKALWQRYDNIKELLMGEKKSDMFYFINELFEVKTPGYLAANTNPW